MPTPPTRSPGAYAGKPPSEASGTRPPPRSLSESSGTRPPPTDPIAQLTAEVTALRRELNEAERARAEDAGKLLADIAAVRHEQQEGEERVMGELLIEREHREGYRDSEATADLNAKLEATSADLIKVTTKLGKTTGINRLLKRALTGATAIALAAATAFVDRACTSREITEAAEQVAVAAAEQVATPVATATAQATAQATATAAHAQSLNVTTAADQRITELEAKLDAIADAVGVKPKPAAKAKRRGTP